MKNKIKGFTYIECIVSLSIMIIAVSLIYTSLYGSFNLTNKNSNYNEMLNIAKSTLEDAKYTVYNTDEEIISNYYDIVEKNGYAVHTKLEKIRNYYQCYKIDVCVNNKNANVELSSYVTQQ